MSSVNPRMSIRAQKAHITRRTMIDSARELFVGQGYALTTMDQIALRAGVAVQTVYYTFKSKGQLLCEVVEVTAAGGDTPVPVPQRPWAIEMLSATSGPRVLALGVEHGTAIYERVAVLWPAVRAAAAADPTVEQYWRGVAANRRNGQRAMVVRIEELDCLSPNLDVGHATDLVAVLLGHDVYSGLVQEAGWPVPAYRGWLFGTLTDQLLRAHTFDPMTVSDLSFAADIPGRRPA